MLEMPKGVKRASPTRHSSKAQLEYSVLADDVCTAMNGPDRGLPSGNSSNSYSVTKCMQPTVITEIAHDKPGITLQKTHAFSLVVAKEYTQSGSCRFLAYIPS